MTRPTKEICFVIWQWSTLFSKYLQLGLTTMGFVKSINPWCSVKPNFLFYSGLLNLRKAKEEIYWWCREQRDGGGWLAVAKPWKGKSQKKSIPGHWGQGLSSLVIGVCGHEECQPAHAQCGYQRVGRACVYSLGWMLLVADVPGKVQCRAKRHWNKNTRGS